MYRGSCRRGNYNYWSVTAGRKAPRTHPPTQLRAPPYLDEEGEVEEVLYALHRVTAVHEQVQQVEALLLLDEAVQVLDAQVGGLGLLVVRSLRYGEEGDREGDREEIRRLRVW